MTSSEQVDTYVVAAREAMTCEAEAIVRAADRLDAPLAKAIELLLKHTGKTVVSGMGKSGYVAQKIAATLSSTGTPAVFLHPAEAVHGDLGMYAPGDPTILISKSGSTHELIRLVPILRNFTSPMIAIVGNMYSRLAREVDVVFDASVVKEADPLGIVPTASAAVALAIGDALACALMSARGFRATDFARFHPAGQLGRNLHLRVSDVMHRNGEIAWAVPGDSLRDVVISMTEHPLGAACVIDPEGILLGIITDGDLRRALRRYESIAGVTAEEVMCCGPVTAPSTASLSDAIRIMEDRPSQIYVLPVVDPGSGRCEGLIRLHDIYQPGLG